LRLALTLRPRTTFVGLRVHAPVNEDVCSTVVTAAEAHRLGAALISLSPDQPFAIELAFFAGLTHEQIAELTGVPLGTVKGRVRLGLRRLRHALQDLAPSSSGTLSIQVQAA
jgi:DNA-directed RNA polymerase specialized sigma24 family protein